MPKKKDIMKRADFISTVCPEALTMDGYDDCIIGICERFGQETIVAYDREKVIRKLAEVMTYEEAIEFFVFNQLGAGMGERTPCFVSKFFPD